MGMSLKRGREPEPQKPQGPSGSFLGGMADTPWGMPCLLFVLVILTMALFCWWPGCNGQPAVLKGGSNERYVIARQYRYDTRRPGAKWTRPDRRLGDNPDRPVHPVCFAGRLRRSEGWALMPGLSWG